LSKVPAYVTITGINGYSPLKVPIAEETDIRGGLMEPTSPKISNDPNVDVQVNLSTFPLFVDLSNGAWARFHDPNAHRYNEPVFTAGTTTPLAWTASPEMGIAPGCANIDQSGAFAFKQIISFNGSYYGLDIKNNKVWKNNGGLTDTWTDTGCPAAGNYTELALNPASTRMYVGCTSGNAYYYNGTSWSDAGYRATHYCAVGKDWFYSTIASGTFFKLIQDTPTSPATVNVGLPNTAINAILHYQNRILIAKPEGVFEWNPNSKNRAEQIFFSLDQNVNNCRFLTLHGGSVYFNSGEGFFEYDGRSVLSKNFALFEGKPTRAFYGGMVTNAYSDGRNLWLVFQVTTEDGYYNTFLVLWSGRTNGFHPIFVNSSATNPAWASGSGAWRLASAVWFDSQKVRYSIGYASASGSKTGILLTDGEVPMAVDSTYPYTWNVGITAGWADFGRDWVDKWLKGVRISTRDLYSGTQVATFTVYYKKWTDTAWTLLGSVVGTQDNAAILDSTTPVPGFTTTKLDTKIVLTNAGTASQRSNAAWVQSLHWMGTVEYTQAFHATITTTLDMENDLESATDETVFNGATILAGLRAGIAQTSPVQLTMPDGQSYIGRLGPAGMGDIIDTIDRQTGLPRDRRFAFVFTELV
jgi:hypothetical protein